jgi:ABC-2 type transport system permease protein
MAIATSAPAAARRRSRPAAGPLATLVLRRLALTIRTPRELLVPLLTPVLFAVLIAPALRQAVHADASYEAYVALGTAGLLIPLNAMLAGIGAIVDRESGAQRELLTAPIPRSLIVVANLVVAVLITALQLAALLGAAVARGVTFHASGTGVLWFVGAALLLAVTMYGVAETLASRIRRQEEYVGRVPAVAIVPWFVAGSLFPITALPLAITWIGRFLPLTHVLALMRYGLLGDSSGLHDIWRSSSVTAMAAMSLGVVAAFAALLTLLAIRSFTRAARA